MNSQPTQSRLRNFLGLYSLANIGAHIAFVPLLSFLLPLKAALIAPDEKMRLLSIVLLIAAVMASISNVLGGMASDAIYARTKNRAGQIATSLLLTLFSYYLFWKADDWASLIFAILIFELSFNFLFAPLGTLLADCVPDGQKGRAAALLNLGTPLATLSIAILAIPLFAEESQRLSLIAAIVAITIIPLVIFIKKAGLDAIASVQSDESAFVAKAHQSDFVWAWIARLLVQFSGAVIFAYLLYFLQDIVEYAKLFPGQKVDQGMGKLAAAATLATIVVGILAGMISDKFGLRRPFLIVSALITGGSILAMSLSSAWPIIFLSYIILICGLTIFLTTNAALVAQLLSGDQKRARKLGLMNLTNTIPAILAPATALILSNSSPQGETLIHLMQFAGALAIFGALAASRIRTVA